MDIELVLLTTYLFVVGLLFGSFFNVVGYRIPAKQSLLGRSKCPSCNTSLGIIELIPILGYGLLRGKCKHCQESISIKYPLFELMTGLLFAIAYLLTFEVFTELLVILSFISLLVIVTISDLNYRIVPDSVLLFFLPLFVVLRIISPTMIWYDWLIGGIIGFGFMYSIAWYGKKRFGKEALGGGDIKLYGLIGIVLGYNTVLLSVFFAGVFGIVYYLLFRPKGSYIPFVPFIALGSILTYFIGPTVIEWYVSLLV